MTKLLFPVALVSAALALTAQTALAAGNVYTGQGSDISWPQCGKSFPTGVAFGIVGVDHGRPFDPDNQYGPNPCLGSEYAWARKTSRADLYINTGYDPTYYTNHLVSSCDTQSKTMTALDAAHQAAWEVGCATAWFNYNYVTGTGANSYGYTQQGISFSGMWWLDVETGNSWSTTDPSLNSETLQGVVDELTGLSHLPVGAYSTSYQWDQIAGANPVGGLTAIWIATGQRSSRKVTDHCTDGFDGFSRGWLVQWVGRVDYDVSCG